MKPTKLVSKALSIAALLASLASASAAHAETPDELFQRGRSLAVANHYAEACPLLAASVKAEPGIGARLWLAECYEKTGRLASALAEFQSAAAQAAEHDDDRQKVALRRASALEPRVPRLMVAAADGVTLTLDDALVDAGTAGPVDAGLHTIAATAPGFVRWTVSVAVPQTPGIVTVNVPALEPEAVAPAPAPAAAAPPAPLPEPAPAPVLVRSSGLGGMKIASLATGAIGLAALGGGVFFGLQASSTYASSNENGHCVQDACDSTGKDLRRSATSMATLSTVAFAGAGVAIASSIVLFVLAPSTSVAPAVGPHEAGLSLTRRF
jgi:serine/threonine-protein kinase